MPQDRAIREKLINQGVATLTDAELISVIIKDSNSPISSAEVATEVLSANNGSLSHLAKAGIKTLRMTAGLGLKRAVVLSAALELGRRLAIEEVVSPDIIRTSEDVERIFRPQIASLPHEEFWVLYLSSANTVVGKVKVSQGGVSGTTVDHKLILKRAVELLASGLILVHNHPSGIAQPSNDDIHLTEKIVNGAALFDILVLDHLIITISECLSFRQAGLIK